MDQLHGSKSFTYQGLLLSNRLHPLLASGNIKNIVVNAAFLAAENSDVIAIEDVIKSAKRGFQKIEKIYSQSEFGKYYRLICKE